ncbi:hypothetical protein ACFSL6_05810 [Paenibacillus thailandensis]|jgi:hypothetical protein|uniref:Uncharacterized protein n=1 Tax=Paenibacillus thailandensis TaxID=393250 RepID=A0ABW5QTC3_9BACL
MERTIEYSRFREERQIKLEFIASIAKSQHALARILESVADIADHSEETARLIGENVSRLAELQAALTESVTGLKLKSGVMLQGRPVKPWLNPQLQRCSLPGRYMSI